MDRPEIAELLYMRQRGTEFLMKNCVNIRGVIKMNDVFLLTRKKN